MITGWTQMWCLRWYRDERGDVILRWPYWGDDDQLHWYWWD
jgi:hypothetical protein